MTGTLLMWSAGDKEQSHPYICQSDCSPGYIWQKNIRRCVKIVRDQKSSHSGAMVACQKEEARLLSINSCQELENFVKDLKTYWNGNEEKYWIGINFGINSERNPIKVRKISLSVNLFFGIVIIFNVTFYNVGLKC